jgi:hypothetical protein
MKKWLVLFALATLGSAAYAASPVEDEQRLDCLVRCVSAGIDGGTCNYICSA